MSIKVEYGFGSGNVEDINVFIKESKLEPKIEFDPESTNTDKEVITIDPLDVLKKEIKKEEIILGGQGVKILSCKLCKNDFPTNFYLQLHFKNVHEEKNKMSTINYDLNDETIEEIRGDSEVQIPILYEDKMHFYFILLC